MADHPCHHSLLLLRMRLLQQRMRMRRLRSRLQLKSFINPQKGCCASAQQPFSFVIEYYTDQTHRLKSEILDLFQASLANFFVLEVYDIIHIVAKKAGRMIFLQNNTLILSKNFQRVANLNIQILSDLRWKHNSSKLVNLTNHSGRLHVVSPFRRFFLYLFKVSAYSIIIPFFRSVNIHFFIFLYFFEELRKLEGRMLGKIFGILTILAFLFGLGSGNAVALGNALLDGAESAVSVTLSLCGMMCLWGGMMRVLSEAGAVQKLSRLLTPFLRFFFPNAYQTGEGLEEISANISANLLGIGNAATPLAIRAMEEMQKHNPTPETASAEQITLSVLNTASLTLLPANLLALRRAAGSQNPYSVLLPVWITSFLCSSMALFLTALPRLWKEKVEKRSRHTSFKKRGSS